MILRFTPLSRRCVAKECLRLCTDAGLVIPAFLHACLNTTWIVSLLIGCPCLCPSKRYRSGLYARQYIRNISRIFSDNSVYLYLFPFPSTLICLRSESISEGSKLINSEIRNPEE